MKGSLVQIHYHNRPGGVSAVMERYERAFHEASGGAGASMIVCARDKNASGARFQNIVHVEECGYRVFTSARFFFRVSNALRTRLGEIIADSRLPRPVFVVGHNLNLCKNAALSHGFARLARDLAKRKDDVRFFSVVHDFAEQGRVDLMAQARLLRRFGIGIWDALYPVLPNLRYVAVSKETHEVLRKAGFTPSLVPNPVVTPPGEPQSNGRAARLSAFMKIERGVPVLFYPGRIVSRKNPVEALVLAHCFFSAALILGEDGTSEADRALAGRLKLLCRRHGVRALFSSAVKKSLPYSRLYGAADACVSTSVLEGFGYGLFEPWLYGKAVAGRLPCGVLPDEIPGVAELYGRFLIPREWLDVEKLKRMYFRRIRLCFGGWPGGAASFSRSFDREFVRGGGIDFGCLDVSTQCAVFDAVCESVALAEQWKAAFPAQTGSLVASFERALHPSGSLVSANRRVVKTGHGADAFRSSFAACLTSNAAAVSGPRPGHPRILRHFRSLARFRLLATPEAPGGRHCCTVSA
jgi:glycosyltransferase involved in cell wall biosynthesis